MVFIMFSYCFVTVVFVVEVILCGCELVVSASHLKVRLVIFLQLNSALLSSVQLSSARLSSAQLSSSAQFSAAQRSSAQLSSAQASSA